MTHTLGSIFLLCVLLCSLSCAQEDRPTTPFFPEVFLGKCYLQNPSGVDCYGLLNNFSVAASTSNYHQNDALYDGFFSLANFSTPKSSIMFWSGSKDFALAVSGNDNRFVTVEETSTGFIINSLSWCGTPDNKFNYATPCPYNGNTTSGYYGTDGVWKRASKAFAEGAAGTIYVLLQPPQYGAPIAYRPWSIFGSIEFPALNVSKIEKIVVLLLVNSTSAPEEKCGSGSLLELNQLIIAKFGFEMDCMDDPKDIYTLFCPLGTSSGQCLAATLVYNYESAVNPPKDKDHFIWAIITTVLAGVFFIITLLLLLRVATLRKRYDYEPVRELDHK